MKKITLFILTTAMLFVFSCGVNPTTPTEPTATIAPQEIKYSCFATEEGWRIIVGDYPEIDHSDAGCSIHYKVVMFTSLTELRQRFIDGSFDSHEKESLEAYLPYDAEERLIIFDLSELAYPLLPEGTTWNDKEEITLTREVGQPGFSSLFHDDFNEGKVYMFITADGMQQNISNLRVTRENTDTYREINVLRNGDELQDNDSAAPIFMDGAQYINSYGEEVIQIHYEFTENNLQYSVYEELDADQSLKSVKIYVCNDNHYFLYDVPNEMFQGKYPTKEEITTFGIKTEEIK